VRAMSMSHDGGLIAVGYGRPSAPGRSHKDGGIELLHGSTLASVLFLQESTDWVREVKFSQDSSLLVVSTQASSVRVKSCCVCAHALLEVAVLTCRVEVRAAPLCDYF
jgi:hypothetical protein